jgi:hypothetical protein
MQADAATEAAVLTHLRAFSDTLQRRDVAGYSFPILAS